MASTSTRRALIVLDHLFTDELASMASKPLVDAGWDVERVHWPVATIEDQRTEIRRLENEGPSDSDTFAPLDEAHDFEIIITQFGPLSARAIANGRRLKLIAINRAGIQNLDAEAAKSHDVDIFNVPGRNTNAVAEHTIGLMLAHLRFIARAHSALKSGEWMEDFPAPGPRELAEVTVGIVGYGHIGRRVHDLLRPFGSEVVVYDPYCAEPPQGAQLVSLDELVSRSDVVTIHVPLSDTTRDLISAKEFGLMKPGAIVVNTARAEIVNQAALREAISSKTLWGAALDVFDTEPLSAEDVFVTAESTTITPHLAGTTRQAFIQGPLWIAERLSELVNN